jgi:hypothetical protein
MLTLPKSPRRNWTILLMSLKIKHLIKGTVQWDSVQYLLYFEAKGAFCFHYTTENICCTFFEAKGAFCFHYNTETICCTLKQKEHVVFTTVTEHLKAVTLFHIQ